MKSKILKASHRIRVYIAWQTLSYIPTVDRPRTLQRAIELLGDTLTARPPRAKGKNGAKKK